jgi:hypothetical protein
MQIPGEKYRSPSREKPFSWDGNGLRKLLRINGVLALRGGMGLAFAENFHSPPADSKAQQFPFWCAWCASIL